MRIIGPQWVCDGTMLPPGPLLALLGLLLATMLQCRAFSLAAPTCLGREATRRRALMPDGFDPPDVHGRGFFSGPKLDHGKPVRVTNVEDLKQKIKLGYRVRDLDVRGDVVSVLKDHDHVHPVVRLLHKRKAEGSKSGQRNDDHRVAIAIEGGGMRGCVSAGMVSALWYLGLQDSLDVVYGSSAGALIGAYFIANQMPYEGPEVYYDVLTTAGKNFIDKRALLRSVGLGLLDLRPSALKALLTDRVGGRVLNLRFLFDTIVQRVKPLHWDAFWARQHPGGLPLKVVTSGLLSRSSVCLSAPGNFQSLADLSQCIQASMLLPGITGEAIQLKGHQVSDDLLVPDPSTRVSEPLVDALLFEPVPYRSALREGSTHVVAFRTRADDLSVTQKMSVMEKMIMTRFFGRKLGLPELVEYMHNQYHKLLYAEDMLRLNMWQRERDEQARGPKVFTVALPPGVKEIGRMEDNREVIFNNVRYGFAAAYDALVLDSAERGRGAQVAKEVWPDSIVQVPPPAWTP